MVQHTHTKKDAVIEGALIGSLMALRINHFQYSFAALRPSSSSANLGRDLMAAFEMSHGISVPIIRGTHNAPSLPY